MIPRTVPWLLTVVAACLFASCGDQHPDHDSEHAHDADQGHAHDEDQGHAHDQGQAQDHHGAHGGVLIEVGDHAAHVEFLHDAKAGTVTLHLVRKDGKTPLVVTHAPELKLVTKKGPKVLDTKPVGGTAAGASQFQVTDPLLQTDVLEGRIALEIGGKPYNPEIEGVHGHK